MKHKDISIKKTRKKIQNNSGISLPCIANLQEKLNSVQSNFDSFSQTLKENPFSLRNNCIISVHCTFIWFSYIICYKESLIHWDHFFLVCAMVHLCKCVNLQTSKCVFFAQPFPINRKWMLNISIQAKVKTHLVN